LYEIVVVAPLSYEHAHTSTGTLRKQSRYSAASASKHTVPCAGASPRAGCAVASQPASDVPHEPAPGARDGMRLPVPIVYQSASRRSHSPGLPASARLWTSRHGWLSSFNSPAACGQPAWHMAAGRLAGDHGGEGGGDGGTATDQSLKELRATLGSLLSAGSAVKTHVGTSGGGRAGGGAGGGDGGDGGGGDGGGTEGGGAEGGHAAMVSSIHVVNSQLRPLVAAGHAPVERPGKLSTLSSNVPFSGLPPSLAFLKGYAARVDSVPPFAAAPLQFLPLQSTRSCRY
jgi:hypothetical protein